MNVQSQYHLLKTRRFLPLFITQFFNAFNDNVFKNALVILITFAMVQSIESEQYYIALAGGIFILPFFILSATAGQIADKYEKSFLIRCIKFLEIIFMIVGIIGFYLHNIFLLMTTLFFLGCHSTFFGPIKYSILPEQLHKNELIAGNGLIEAGTFIAILVGQILGGSLILLPKGLFYIALALLTIAILGFISCLFIPKTQRGQPDLHISANIVTQTYHIIKLVGEKRDILLAIMGISWFWFIGATFLTQFPTFIKSILHANSQIFILFLTIFSVGIGIGSLLCNRLLKGKISAAYVPHAIVGMSIFTLDIYFATAHLNFNPGHLISISEFFTQPHNIRILADVFALTICGGLFVVPLYAIIQEQSAEAMRSRIIAGNNIVNAFFMVFSAIYVIIATSLGFTIPQLFLLAAIANLYVGFLTRKLTKHR